MSTSTPTFEESLRRLEEIVQSLEAEKVSLEDSVGLYEEGLKLIKSCNVSLDEAKLRVEKVNEANDSQL